ncbi:TetR family transcriptional regulator [Actinokineospora sp. G85]|uniref:TetR family transcriptional regulator n=1 Tax=Actinokineospora sp. G85 TaxID=3406626 RepID=UPI003C774C73
MLVDSGYDAFSTNRVAAAAGISPGSFYQYFPDKAAVVDVIVDRYWDEVADQVAAALAARPGDPGRSPDVQAWVIVLAVENLTLRWVLDEPGADRAQLLDEIVRLVTGYVSPARLGGPGPA